MPNNSENDSTLSPEQVAARVFPVGFRGYDQNEVRSFLATTAAELAAARKQIVVLEARRDDGSAAASSEDFDEDRAVALVGAEAAAILRSARQGAKDVVRRAEDDAVSILTDARDEAAEVTAESRAFSERTSAEAAETRVQAEQDAATARREATEAAAATTAEAEETQRKVAQEAQGRRRKMRRQYAQLIEIRDRFLGALDEAQGEVGRARTDVLSALPDVDVDDAEGEDDDESPAADDDSDLGRDLGIADAAPQLDVASDLESGSALEPDTIGTTEPASSAPGPSTGTTTSINEVAGEPTASDADGDDLSGDTTRTSGVARLRPVETQRVFDRNGAVETPTAGETGSGAADAAVGAPETSPKAKDAQPKSSAADKGASSASPDGKDAAAKADSAPPRPNDGASQSPATSPTTAGGAASSSASRSTADTGDKASAVSADGAPAGADSSTTDSSSVASSKAASTSEAATPTAKAPSGPPNVDVSAEVDVAKVDVGKVDVGKVDASAEVATSTSGVVAGAALGVTAAAAVAIGADAALDEGAAEPSASDLFERMRAERSERAERARRVLAESTSASDPTVDDTVEISNDSSAEALEGTDPKPATADGAAAKNAGSTSETTAAPSETPAEKTVAAATSDAPDDKPQRTPRVVPVTESTTGTDPPEAATVSTDESAGEANSRNGSPADATDGVDRGDGPSAEILGRRDAALETAVPTVVRSVRRALGDDQNQILQRLRTGRGRYSADDVLLDETEHFERLVGSSRSQIRAAVTDGVDLVGADRQPESDTIDELTERALAVLAAGVGGVLRSRIDRRTSEAADRDEVADVIRPIYREVKSQHLETAARESLLTALALGCQFGDANVTRSAWSVDPRCGNPDCGDNGLGGPVDLGQPFPSGHVNPPTHIECGCLAEPDR